ncbi:MAG: TonB C-terminal domain-containing protein [Candidatus Obscuribacterales bacterium]|nr:TonB C-terminal domain-containing protein [Candidatus Obscuribacterales bacterium]
MRTILNNVMTAGLIVGLVSCFTIGDVAVGHSGALAEGASSAVHKGSSPEEFLLSYYAAMAKAKRPQEIEPFLCDAVKSKMKVGPMDKELEPMFVEMIHSTHPAEVKILSKKVEKDRVSFDLLPSKLPPAVLDMSKSENFKMTGTAVVIRQNGDWKIYKDCWVAESSGKDGKMRLAFGTDPDNKNSDKEGLDQSFDGEPQDYSTSLRKHLMNNWKQEGSGKQIYVSMKVSPEGSITDLVVKGEESQKESEELLRTLISSVQPLPVPPRDMLGKPYAWMVFDWSDKGRCISGPYFDDKVPDWVTEKTGTKLAPQAVQ